MDRVAEAQTLAAVYLLYKSHVRELCELGYSRENAFWLHFACLPFLPWDRESPQRLRLSQLLRLYVGIYQYDTDDRIEPEQIPQFIELLAERYRMAKDIVSRSDRSRLQRELARFALPRGGDAESAAQAVSIVLNTIDQWRRQTDDELLPCALVEDLDK